MNLELDIVRFMKKIRRFETYNNKLKKELNMDIDDAKSEMKIVDALDSQNGSEFDKISQSMIIREMNTLNGSITGKKNMVEVSIESQD